MNMNTMALQNLGGLSIGKLDLGLNFHPTNIHGGVKTKCQSCNVNVGGLQDLGIGSIGINTKVITGGIHHTGGDVSFLQDLGAEFPDVHIGTKVITGGIHHTGGDVSFL